MTPLEVMSAGLMYLTIYYTNMANIIVQCKGRLMSDAAYDQNLYNNDALRSPAKFAAALLKLRARLGWTQRDLATAAKCSRYTIMRAERGQRLSWLSAYKLFGTYMLLEHNTQL